MNGHFELNVFNPVMASNVLSSVNLLSNSCSHLAKLVSSLDANLDVINEIMTR